MYYTAVDHSAVVWSRAECSTVQDAGAAPSSGSCDKSIRDGTDGSWVARHILMEVLEEMADSNTLINHSYYRTNLSACNRLPVVKVKFLHPMLEIVLLKQPAICQTQGKWPYILQHQKYFGYM